MCVSFFLRSHPWVSGKIIEGDKKYGTGDTCDNYFLFFQGLPMSKVKKDKSKFCSRSCVTKIIFSDHFQIRF